MSHHLPLTGIHPTAILYPNVYLGKNVTIGPYSVLGTPPEDPRSKGSGIIEIGDDTIIREFVTVHGPISGLTSIGRECYVMSHSHIGHDSEIHDRVIVCARSLVGSYVRVDHDARLGIGCMIHQRRIIGAHSMVGMGAVVVRDVRPWTCVVGNPARFLRKNHQQIPTKPLDVLWSEYEGQGNKDEWIYQLT